MSHPQTNLATEERLKWMTDQLDTVGSIAIAEAAAALGVSEMTVRRDIAELEERGLARRIRGGALPLGPQPFSERKGTRTRAKGQIAAKLADLIPASGTIAMDASSTVMRAAASLSGARDLTVLTNGPDTFATLQGRPGVRALVTGGQLEPQTGSLVGPIACWTAQQIAVQRFIASCAALDAAAGATEAVLEEAELKRAIAVGADEVVLAVDSSKLNRRSVAVALGWDLVDVLVTELDPDDERLDPFRRRVKVR